MRHRLPGSQTPYLHFLRKRKFRTVGFGGSAPTETSAVAATSGLAVLERWRADARGEPSRARVCGPRPPALTQQPQRGPNPEPARGPSSAGGGAGAALERAPARAARVGRLRWNSLLTVPGSGSRPRPRPVGRAGRRNRAGATSEGSPRGRRSFGRRLSRPVGPRPASRSLRFTRARRTAWPRPGRRLEPATLQKRSLEPEHRPRPLGPRGGTGRAGPGSTFRPRGPSRLPAPSALVGALRPPGAGWGRLARAPRTPGGGVGPRARRAAPRGRVPGAQSQATGRRRLFSWTRGGAGAPPPPRGSKLELEQFADLTESSEGVREELAQTSIFRCDLVPPSYHSVALTQECL